ncbi:MAG TPA: amidohydrolase family protein [Fulvivirga sp.]|nr:amidohydrolase family protein [Fulvivirga sp.]
MRKILLSTCLLIWVTFCFAQDNFPINGVKDKRSDSYAFVNATIHTDYQTTIENAVMLIKDGVIQQVGSGISIPKGYTTIDLKGKHLYPSFVEIYGSYGLPDPEKPGRFSWGAAEKIEPQKKGAYNANDAIRSYYKASKEFSIDKNESKSLRNIGFGTVSSFMKDGIARGSSVIATLGASSDNEVVIKENGAAYYSLNRGSSEQYFPVSEMGSIALLRQTYLDAQWYKSSHPFTDIALDGWIANQSLPQIFELGNKYTLLSADAVGDEFGVQYIIKGAGDEYQQITAVKATRAPLIVPVNFPSAYDVSDPIDAMQVSLADMKNWELAPTNPGVLASNGVSFALTTSDLKNKADFIKNIRTALKYNLTEAQALEALTMTPARLLKVDNQVGSLQKNKLANFLITSGKIFDDKTVIYENWVQGEQFVVNKEDAVVKTGDYKLTIGDKNYKVAVSGDPGSYSFKIVVNDSTNINITQKLVDNLITLSYKPENEETVTLSGWKTSDGWKGQWQAKSDLWNAWQLTFDSAAESKTDDSNKEDKEGDNKNDLGNVIYPFVAFGNQTLPAQETMLITNATVWTNESEGILENTDILIQNGKIAKIGKSLTATGAKVIDGTGMHLTSGIIDEHSHIALRSVNDVAVNSSLVRMKDVIDPEDIDIYRQLSGGVTASQLLHGSANPIGGQSAIVKLRWGSTPEQMLIKDADPFIKFALGENVKRSSNSSSIRYPQTRMGVEQVYVDAFTNAQAYAKEWDAYNALSSKEKARTSAPRKDLVNEAMLEILRGKRFITCHSYVQSEINMLMKVADDFGFHVNTFTHILEGYKVADKMKAHGTGGSTFADWWAYKWEVRYAIPYNATLMHNEGVTVAINSDDAEMGRRLNQEAAKSVKYGNMSEEDAWKMVTLNPAKLLHLDDHMGSIKVGKDADVVLWTDNPLSIYAVVDKTIIDGKVYFDNEKDELMRKNILLERERLISKMKGDKKAGKPVQRAKKKSFHNFHCDDIVDRHLISQDQ